MRYAIFTVGLPEWTPETAVREIRAAGYDGVEWRITDQSPAPDGKPDYWAGNLCTWPLSSFVQDAPRIRELTRGAGLEMPSLGTYVNCAALADVETAMKGAALLGAKQLRVNLPAYDATRPFAPQWDRARAQCREVAALAKQYGVRALAELHMGTLAPGAGACAELFRDLDPERVGVIFDAGNLAIEGFEPYPMGLDRLGPLLAHVHLKNVRWESAGRRPDGSAAWRCAQAPMDEGIVDIAHLLRCLRAAGYDGWLSFEDFSPGRDWAERIRRNIAFVKRLEASLA